MTVSSGLRSGPVGRSSRTVPRPPQIAIVANVSSYFPADADEPIVVADDSSLDPRLETFVFGKGKTQGFYWLVPLSPNLSVERYLGVGAFAVGG